MTIQQRSGLYPLLLVPNMASKRPKSSERLGRIIATVNADNVYLTGLRDGLKLQNISSVSALIFCEWGLKKEYSDFLSQFRKLFPNIPVLVIGWSDDEDSRVAAFEAGADNYLHCTFSEREFVAKLNRLMHRTESKSPSILIEDLQIWSESRVAFRAGSPIKLSSKELEVLLFLAANKSNPVSRKELLKEVFGLPFEPGTNLVEVNIHRLRQKIDNGHSRKLLNTIRGSGYVLG